MDRLLKMDKGQFVVRMQAEVRRILEQVADAVNDAPEGNLINGSEVAVRDLMAVLREKVFQEAVQMRINATEASFSPCDRCAGPAEAEQGASQPQHDERQRADRVPPDPLACRRRGQ
jgi:hypothetical protein